MIIYLLFFILPKMQKFHLVQPSDVIGGCQELRDTVRYRADHGAEC
jgi:hypothetical protein